MSLRCSLATTLSMSGEIDMMAVPSFLFLEMQHPAPVQDK
jgi:hypothetical protein